MQEIYQQLVENLSGSVLLVDENCCLEYMNPSAEMLFEISLNRVIGANVIDLIRDHDDFHNVLLEAKKTSHPFTKREGLLMLYNGKELAADYSVTPLVGEQLGSVIIEVFPRDRLIRIGREEDARNQRETSRGLIRGLAHEIKNPLGGIRGAAQLLERALPDDSLSDYTQVIIDEADRLQNLVNRMLGPRNLPQMKPMNIHSILERIYNLMRAETAGDIELIRDYDPSIPEFEGDSEQLIQALLNVVRNGIQALQESGVEQPEMIMRSRAVRQFTLGAQRHRLVCQITIADNGPGIPEDIRETLFYPMISGRADGSGLGLSIAQSIINQHQGLIECKSEPGCTEFMIYIPLEQRYESAK